MASSVKKVIFPYFVFQFIPSLRKVWAYILTLGLAIALDNQYIMAYNTFMSMKQNYPDYNRISEIEKELSKLAPRLEDEEYFDGEAEHIRFSLVEELAKLVMGEQVEVEGKSCKENICSDCISRRDSPIYYPGKVHHLDGDITNDSFDNLAMICPQCQAHILLSRFSLVDIWLLKARGLSNAEMGRLLGISRERVRQLCKKYEAKQEPEIALLEANLDGLVKRAQVIDASLKSEYIEDEDGFILRGTKKGKRLIDRRTLRKRIIAEINKLREGGTK